MPVLPPSLLSAQLLRRSVAGISGWRISRNTALILSFLLASCQIQPATRSGPGISAEQQSTTAVTATASAPSERQQTPPAPENTATSTRAAPGRTSTALKVLTSTSAPTACDNAALIGSVGILDGQIMEPGEPFTKTWRLKNIGTCEWSEGYSVVFDGGAQMDGPDEFPVPDPPVGPGGERDISVQLTAPEDPGTHKGNWKLRNASGEVFGLGLSGGPFWVIIRIPEPTPTETPTPGLTFTSTLTVTASATLPPTLTATP